MKNFEKRVTAAIETLTQCSRLDEASLISDLHAALQAERQGKAKFRNLEELLGTGADSDSAVMRLWDNVRGLLLESPESDLARQAFEGGVEEIAEKIGAALQAKDVEIAELKRMEQLYTSELEMFRESVNDFQKEMAEQCRIIGMSGEREARHLAEIAELRSDRDSWVNQAQARIDDWYEEHEKNVELRGLLGEARDDIKAQVEHEYKGTLDYPIQKRRYDRDMDIVNRITTALAGKEQPK